MKLDAIEAAIKNALFRRWLSEAGLTPEMFTAFEHGIPSAYADAIADSFPEVPASSWPLLVDSPHGTRVLTKRLSKSILQPTMTAMSDEQRLRISRGGGDKDPFRRAVRKAGFTQNGLAKAIGVSRGMMAHYRRADNPTPIPKARALMVAELTGWPADARHWPGGVS